MNKIHCFTCRCDYIAPTVQGTVTADANVSNFIVLYLLYCEIKNEKPFIKETQPKIAQSQLKRLLKHVIKVG